jgi:hypothetical protein
MDLYQVNFYDREKFRQVLNIGKTVDEIVELSQNSNIENLRVLYNGFGYNWREFVNIIGAQEKEKVLNKQLWVMDADLRTYYYLIPMTGVTLSLRDLHIQNKEDFVIKQLDAISFMVTPKQEMLVTKFHKGFDVNNYVELLRKVYNDGYDYAIKHENKMQVTPDW